MLHKKNFLFAIAASGALVLGSWVLISPEPAGIAATMRYDGNEPTSDFKKALEWLYDKGNAQKSLEWFERELAAHADNFAAHFEYGNAMYQLKRYQEAQKAYQKAADGGGAEVAEAYYNMARCAAAQKHYNIGTYLMQASEAGFTDFGRLLGDTAFEQWRESYDFMGTLAEISHYDNKVMGEAFWHFSPKSNKEAYNLDLKALLSENDKEQREYIDRGIGQPSNSAEKKQLLAAGQLKRAISWELEDLVPGAGKGAFSRGGGNNFSMELAYRHTKNYYAVIYKEEVPWADGLTPETYHLVTYSPEGMEVDRLALAFRNLAEAQTVVMQGDAIETQLYQLVWQNEDTDTEQNFGTLKSSQVSATKKYRLSESGKIEPTS